MRFAVAAWGSLGLVLAAASCGTVDPGASKGGAGSAGAAAQAGDGNAGGSGGSAGTGVGAEPGAGGADLAGGAPPLGGSPSAGEGGSGGKPDPGVVEPLLPWRVGNSWTYRVTKAGVVSEKTTAVGDEEAVGKGPHAAVLANHVITDKGAKDHTESWQGPSPSEPGRIVRYRELAFSAATGKLSSETYYDPEKLHVDGTPEHTVAGASWTEEYLELVVGKPAGTTTETWTVVADDETLKVPAGTFEGVIHLQKKGNSTKDYWYQRGVGKLKETGTQTEELVDYTLVP